MTPVRVCRPALTSDFLVATVVAAVVLGPTAGSLHSQSEGDSPEVGVPTAPVVELVPPVGPVIGETTIMALACNDDIREIGFWVDGRFAGADDSPPFELTANFGADLGPHTVRAMAVDKHKVVVGETSLELNRAGTGLFAELQHGRDTVSLVAGAPPGSRKPVAYQVFAGASQVANQTRPQLELSMPAADLHGVDVLRLAAEYADGSRLDRYLVVSEGFSESVIVNEVQLWVTVTDRQGEPVLDLEPAAFSVRGSQWSDDGPTILRPAGEPLTLAVVLDGSDSMAGLRKALRESTEALADEMLGSNDRLLLFGVSDRPRLLNPSGDPQDALEMLDDWVEGGGSALYDSLYFAIRRLRTLDGRKALVLISDGADLHSHLDTERVADAAWRAGVPVFLIAGKMPHDAMSRLRAYNLQRFADNTGGRVLHGGSSKSQNQALETILELLRNPYVLPLSAAAEFDLAELRELTIELPDPKLEARVFLGGNSG